MIATWRKSSSEKDGKRVLTVTLLTMTLLTMTLANRNPRTISHPANNTYSKINTEKVNI